jgi:hypothetical protein
LKNPEIEIFRITSISCSKWNIGNGSADVFAGNYVGDTLEFTVDLHPKNYLVFYNLQVDFYTPELMPYMADDIINEQLLKRVEQELDSWWKDVVELQDALNPKIWDLVAGSAIPDGYYALTALLYEIRSKYSAGFIVESMANDTSATVAATKQRIRKAREKGFLTSPGKGQVGKGRITKKAMTYIRKEKLM